MTFKGIKRNLSSLQQSQKKSFSSGRRLSDAFRDQGKRQINAFIYIIYL